MAQLNISPPKFTEADLDDAKQRQRIMSYLYKLDEQLRYVLNNLDAENFTEEYQKTIETANDRMERTFRDGQAKVMSKVSQTAGEIRAEVNEIQIGGANYLTEPYSVQYDFGGAAANGYVFEHIYQPLEPGVEYTFSVGLIERKAGTTTTAEMRIHNRTTGAFSSSHVFEIGKPERQSATFTAPSSDGVWGVTIYSGAWSQTTGNHLVWNQMKLEKGNKATDWTPNREEFRAGTSVVMNKDQFKVRTKEFVVEVPGEEGSDEAMLHIDKDGVSAKAIECPNVAQRYDGPTTLYVDPNATDAQMRAGNYVRGLQNAFDMLNGKQIPDLITINLAAGITEYGTKSLRAVSGPYWVRIEGDSSNRATLVGKLDIAYNDCLVRVRYLNVQSALNDKGIFCGGGSRLVQIDNCMVTGKGTASTVNGSENGSSTGIHAEYAANVQVTNCELYDTYRSLYVQTLAQMQSQNNKGNCTIGTNRSHIFISGTAPCASMTWTVSKVAGGQAWVDSGVTVNQGSKPSTLPAATTKSYTATAADTWAGSGWNIYNNNDDIYQGYTDALGEHRGCFWFNNSTIKTDVGTKSIKQATLTLYQVSGVGRNQPVQVSLEGITVNKGGDKPIGKTEHEYGVIGTTLGVNRATTFTLPANAINHLVSGTIKGFMVRTGETASAKGDDNSANYARFTGSGTNAPVLTVTYA